MKHSPIATLLLLTIPLVTASGCKDKGNDKPAAGAPAATGKAAAAPAAPAAPIELTATVDLGAGIKDPDETRFQGFKVKAPKGAVVEEGLTGVAVKLEEWPSDSIVKSAYEISVAYDPGYVAKSKGEAAQDGLEKVVKYHLDTPTAILWETTSVIDESSPHNFHFAAEVAVGDAKFKCGNTGYGQFNQAQAEALLKSCQSITK